MKLGLGITHLNRPGAITYFLFGSHGMWMPLTGALQIAPPAEFARRMVNTEQRRCMLSAFHGQGSNDKDIDTKVGSSGIIQATLEIKVASPQEMQDTGAFVGADSTGGDVVLLSG